MEMRGESCRFWLPVIVLAIGAGYIGYKLVNAHINPTVDAPNYHFTEQLNAQRGAIYSSYGESSPIANSVPYWEYSLDPVALTNSPVIPKGQKKRRKKESIVKTIADMLKIDYSKVLAMAEVRSGKSYRNQFLAKSADARVHDVLANRSLVSGVAIKDKQVRQYINGRSMAHIIGGVRNDGSGSAGIEAQYNRFLSGTPGTVRGVKDARGNELYDRREVSIRPIPGADVYLTIDPSVQFEAEAALKWGLIEYGAASGWCIVMNAKTGAIISMATLPDYEPTEYGKVFAYDKKYNTHITRNRAIALNYEPGSVMKVITAASAIDAGFVKPNTLYNTKRDDPRYYRLPGDGSHVWNPTMTIRDAIIHSSNIVIGKLGYDFGSKRLYEYMRRFGFGEKTGIDLPGEEYGILPNPNVQAWDIASCSRAPIGQFVSVTGIQLASAYQAIANGGVRMRPYIVDKVVDSGGVLLYDHELKELGRPIKPETAKTMLEIMKGVTREGTAKRAAICGYSIAGKTGTAQKQMPGYRGYVPNLYRASFCGIVPASHPEIVVLVTLDFDKKATFHQGGNSAAPIFKRIATAALRYLSIVPDQPEELLESETNDVLDKIMDERAESASPNI